VAAAAIAPSGPAAAQQDTPEDAFFAGLDAWRAGDARTARREWEKAATAGDADAQFNLAALLETGRGGPADYDAAATWYAEAARRFVPVAAIRLMQLRQRGLATAINGRDVIDYLKGAAGRGSVRAQFELATAYDRGHGVTQNFASAALWYQRAAEQGLREAQYNLAVLFDEGLGAPRDRETARKWYLLAAERGSAPAQNNIGYLYENGFGVPQDMAEAARWYRLAADAGLAVAQNNLAIMYHYGYGVAKDLAAAIRWYETAAGGGDPGAQNSLGLILANGLGVEQDRVEAMSWFVLGGEDLSDAGAQARTNRDRLAGELTPAELADAQRRAGAKKTAIERRSGPDREVMTRPLAPHQMDDIMIAAQRYLRVLGHYDAKVDGIPGGMTSEAVVTFQREAGLEINGLVTSQLIKALRKAAGR